MNFARRSSIAVAVAFLLPRLALAEPARDPVSAQLLFEQGRDALEQGEVDRACGLLAESLRLDPAVGTLFNLAACEERQGKLATAWQHWREGIGQLSLGDTRMEAAEARARELEPRVPRLAVRFKGSTVAGAKVLRDGVELQGVSLGLELPVNPGAHTVVVLAPGRKTRQHEIVLVDSERRTLLVEPGPPAPLAMASVDNRTQPDRFRTAGFVTYGVGAAAIGLGTIAGIVAIDGGADVRKHCDRSSGICDGAGLDALDRTKTFGAISTASFVAAGALVVAGTVMVLMPSRRRAFRATLSPMRMSFW